MKSEVGIKIALLYELRIKRIALQSDTGEKGHRG